MANFVEPLRPVRRPMHLNMHHRILKMHASSAHQRKRLLQIAGKELAEIRASVYLLKCAPCSLFTS